MARPTTAQEAVDQALLEPQSITDTEGRTIVNRSLKDLQDARDREQTTASGKNHFGLRFTKLVPPAGG